MTHSSERQAPFHHWKARLFIGILMISLSFLGLVITEIKQDGAWNYWRFLSAVFAILSISLHLFLKRKESVSFLASFWHEVFHWLGLLLSVSVISIMVEVGILGRFVSSISVIMLLALTTYLAGIYTDITLIFVGVFLGLFAAGLSIVSAYLYPIVIPLIFIGIIVLWVLLKKKHVYHKSKTEDTL